VAVHGVVVGVLVLVGRGHRAQCRAGHAQCLLALLEHRGRLGACRVVAADEARPLAEQTEVVLAESGVAGVDRRVRGLPLVAGGTELGRHVTQRLRRHLDPGHRCSFPCARCSARRTAATTLPASASSLTIWNASRSIVIDTSRPKPLTTTWPSPGPMS